MSYQTGCYKKVPNLRTRAIDEWESLMVFTPDEPNIYLLNTNTWLILELCDGKTQQELEESYVAAVASILPPEEAKRHLQKGLEVLAEGHMIEQVA